MLVKMYWRALCVAPLLLSGVTFAAPHLAIRQSGDGGFFDQAWDTYYLYRSKFHEWRQQNFPGGKSGPHPETVSSPETVPSLGLPGELNPTPNSQPQSPPAASHSGDVEIIIEALAECSDSAPLTNMPSTVSNSIHGLRLG